MRKRDATNKLHNCRNYMDKICPAGLRGGEKRKDENFVTLVPIFSSHILLIEIQAKKKRDKKNQDCALFL